MELKPVVGKVGKFDSFGGFNKTTRSVVCDFTGLNYFGNDLQTSFFIIFICIFNNSLF